MFKKIMLNKRERVFLYIAITVIIFSIGFNLVIAPVLKKNDILNKEISINRAKLNKYMRLFGQKDYIQNKYSKFASGINLSEGGRDTPVNVFSELENLAKAANIRIIDLRPESPRSIDLYKEINIGLRTEGTIQDYLKFIYDIENSLSVLKIKRLQLNAKPNTLDLEGIFSISQLSVSE